MPPALYARNMVAFCHAELGEFEPARGYASESESFAQPLDLPFGLVLARLALAYTDLLQERFESATGFTDRALAVSQSRDVPAWMPWLAGVRGYALALSGRVPEGIKSLELSLARAVALPFLFGHSQWQAWLAHAHHLAGHGEEAARFAAEALSSSRERGERGYEAWALWVQGEIGGDAAAAAAHEGMLIADELGMRPLVARCELTLAALQREAGDLDAARELLGRAVKNFTALDMPGSGQRASALLVG